MSMYVRREDIYVCAEPYSLDCYWGANGMYDCAVKNIPDYVAHRTESVITTGHKLLGESEFQRAGPE